MHSTLNLGLDIRIPPEYISDEHQRLRAYKRIADAATPEAAAEALAELEDRYGPAPEAVRNLLKFSALKGSAQKLGIEAIDRRAGVLNVKFHKEAHIDPKRLMTLVTRHGRRAVHARRRAATAARWRARCRQSFGFAGRPVEAARAATRRHRVK